MASQPPKPKRGPSVLVTDARDSSRSAPQRPGLFSRQTNPSGTKLISVDNVLQYASEVPSGQRRGPPSAAQLARGAAGRHPIDPRLSSRMIQQHIPSRTSKISEKLVLLPETEGEDDEDDTGEFARSADDGGPPKDADLEKKRRPIGLKEKSYAETLPKSSRTEKLSRVTAYCTAHAYKMKATAEFVRKIHGARTKLYDDCLYTVYHLPLLPGVEGYRIRSSPVLKSPGGKAVLDEEIERNERHEYREGFFGEERYEIRGPDESPNEGEREHRHSTSSDEDDRYRRRSSSDEAIVSPHQLADEAPDLPISRYLTSELSHSTSSFAEMFIFSYGVVVFWNFTEKQEKDILADLTFSSSPLAPHGGVPLAVNPQMEEDFETEELHFEYNPEIPRPRVFNDMITLRSADHMIKLTMSHAIAQSTKLSFFEERMEETMEEAQYVPRRLALQGTLGMKREEVVMILGKLFKSRVDVNLSSNILASPNFFWDSEPTLHPLYTAVREYLEISPRIQVLNERCQVFLDLAECLSDMNSDRQGVRLTWIIIILIVLSILVTCSEVFLRFGIVSKKGAKAAALSGAAVPSHGSMGFDGAGMGGLRGRALRPPGFLADL